MGSFMNLVLLTDSDFISHDQVRLTGRRLEHITQVHRATEGAALKVGRLNGEMGLGVIEAMDEEQLTLRVKLDTPP